MDILSIGAAGAGALGLAIYAARRGIPASWSMLKDWWVAGAAALASVKADLADAHDKIAKLETRLDKAGVAR